MREFRTTDESMNPYVAPISSSVPMREIAEGAERSCLRGWLIRAIGVAYLLMGALMAGSFVLRILVPLTPAADGRYIGTLERFLTGLPLLVFATFGFVIGMGLLNLRGWARWPAIIQAVLFATGAVLLFVGGRVGGEGWRGVSDAALGAGLGGVIILLITVSLLVTQVTLLSLPGSSRAMGRSEIPGRPDPRPSAILASGRVLAALMLAWAHGIATAALNWLVLALIFT